MNHLKIISPLREELPEKYNNFKIIAKSNGFLELHDKIVQRSRDLDKRLMIMVVGQGNFGKSTLINNFLGKEVAPVNFLPKTWKIDIYYPTTGKEYAEIYWNNNKPAEVVSIDEAKRICEIEEKKRSDRKKNKDRIVCEIEPEIDEVQWFLNIPGYSDEFCLVDTPGLGQQRDDTEVQSINLFGSKGIELSTNDPFLKYYHRADLVLWCFRADKQNPKQTDEMLRRVQPYNKKILGLITHMDRVPTDQWPEVKSQIKSYFGEFVDDYICLAAGKDQELQHKTYSTLRDELKGDILPKCEELKALNHLSFYCKEALEFSGHLDTIAKKYYQVNSRTMLEAMKHSEHELISTIKRADAKCNDIINEYFDEKVKCLDSLWERASSSQEKTIEKFKKLLEVELQDCKQLDWKLRSIAEAEFKTLEFSINSYLNHESWVSIKLSGTDKELLRNSIKIDLKLYQQSLSCTDFGEIRSNEGDAEALGVGAVGAVVGACLLGPIGLLGAGIGFFAKVLLERSKTIEKVTDGLEESRSKTLGQSLATLVNSGERFFVDVCREIEASHNSYVGKNISEVIRLQKTFDMSVNSIGVVDTQLNTQTVHEKKSRQANYQFGIIKQIGEYDDLIKEYQDGHLSYLKNELQTWDDSQDHAAAIVIDDYRSKAHLLLQSAREIIKDNTNYNQAAEQFYKYLSIEEQFDKITMSSFVLLESLHRVRSIITFDRFHAVKKELSVSYRKVRNRFELPFIRLFCDQQVAKNDAIRRLTQDYLESVSHNDLALLALHKERTDIKDTITSTSIMNEINLTEYKGYVSNFEFAATCYKDEIDKQLVSIERHLNKHIISNLKIFECQFAAAKDSNEAFDYLNHLYQLRMKLIEVDEMTRSFLSVALQQQVQSIKFSFEKGLILYQVEAVQLKSSELVAALNLSYDWSVASADSECIFGDDTASLTVRKISSRLGDHEKIAQYLSCFEEMFIKCKKLENDYFFDDAIISPYNDLLSKTKLHIEEVSKSMDGGQETMPYPSHAGRYFLVTLFFIPFIISLSISANGFGGAFAISFFLVSFFLLIVYGIRRSEISSELENRILNAAKKKLSESISLFKKNVCENLSHRGFVI